MDEPRISEILRLAEEAEREQAHEDAKRELFQLVEEEELAQACSRRNRLRRAALAAAAALLVLSAVAAAAAVYVRLLGRVTVDSGTRPSGYSAPPQTTEEPDPDFPAMYDITDASDLHGFLRRWWYNGGEGEIRYSKDVLNVLLLGEDNPDGAEYGRSDSIILVSVNRNTNTVSMISLLRDSYCYMNIDGEERWGRINAAFNNGGPAAMMETVTRLYKIRVDKYVSVNFGSFKKLIDTLGGVVVDVTPQEARYINNTAKSMNRRFPSGEGVRLNGAQALVYSRIRKLDSDNARVSRQQKVIRGLMESARGASLAQLYAAMEGVLAQVTTNFTQQEITKMIPQAVGWLRFGTQQAQSPLTSGKGRSAIGAYINGAQVWVVDYPLAAQQVQMTLYGESNIDIEADGARSRYIIDLFRRAADNGSLESDHYGGQPVAPRETSATARNPEEPSSDIYGPYGPNDPNAPYDPGAAMTNPWEIPWELPPDGATEAMADGPLAESTTEPEYVYTIDPDGWAWR